MLLPLSPHCHFPSPRSYIATTTELPRSQESVWKILVWPASLEAIDPCNLSSRPYSRDPCRTPVFLRAFTLALDDHTHISRSASGCALPAWHTVLHLGVLGSFPCATCEGSPSSVSARLASVIPVTPWLLGAFAATAFVPSLPLLVSWSYVGSRSRLPKCLARCGGSFFGLRYDSTTASCIKRV